MIQKREGIWSPFGKKWKKSKPAWNRSVKNYKVKMHLPRTKLLPNLHKDKVGMKKLKLSSQTVNPAKVGNR